MCWYPALVSFGFIQKSHLNITPHAHPAEDEIQVPLIVVITVIVAVAGQELFIFCVIMKQFAVCGNILANCTWTPESAPMECKIIYKHRQSPEIKRKQSASQHIPSIIFHKSHWKTPSGWLDLMVLTFLKISGGSGGLQSFLLIRELILERRPQPVNTPEPMEPIEPTEGGEDLQGGWSLGETETRGFWDFCPKEFLKRELKYPLGFSHIFWERRLNCCGFHKDLWVSFAACMCTSSDFHSILPFILCHYRFVDDECVSENCWQDQHLPRWKPNPKSSKQFPNLVQKHMKTSDFLILLLLLIISHDSCVTNHDSWFMNHESSSPSPSPPTVAFWTLNLTLCRSRTAKWAKVESFGSWMQLNENENPEAFSTWQLDMCLGCSLHPSCVKIRGLHLKIETEHCSNQCVGQRTSESFTCRETAWFPSKTNRLNIGWSPFRAGFWRVLQLKKIHDCQRCSGGIRHMWATDDGNVWMPKKSR